MLRRAEDDDAAYWCRLAPGASEALLPVYFEDVDNDPMRPYRCVETARYMTLNGPRPSVMVAFSTVGFAEPHR